MSRLDAALREAGRAEPDPDEQARLAATLGAVRDALAALLPPDPASGGVVVAGPPGLVPAGPVLAARLTPVAPVGMATASPVAIA